MATGANVADLDFDSVQRGNAEIAAARAGGDRPLLAGWATRIRSSSIHDVGAGGLSNALPELVHGGGAARRGVRPARDPVRGAGPVAARTLVQRGAGALRARDRAADLERFDAICRRERAPVRGRRPRDAATRRLVVEDPRTGDRPVDVPLDVIFGKPPRMTRDVRHRARAIAPFDARGIALDEALRRVLRFPAVADKTFLVTIGDRTVGGLCARDPMVGPWQVPVADVAVTLMDFAGHAGEAMAMGERTPLALIDGPASGRMAVAEALTNLAAADVGALDRVKLSANWMAPAGHPGEDAVLYDTVEAVSRFCIALGVSIPVGKDSMSMRTAWREQGVERAVTAPVSLIVTAFAPVDDVAPHRDAAARRVERAARLVWLQAMPDRHRLGASALAQVDRAARRRGARRHARKRWRRWFGVVAACRARGHAARLPRRRRRRRDRRRSPRWRSPRAAASTSRSTGYEGDPLALLFAEEIGASCRCRRARAPGWSPRRAARDSARSCSPGRPRTTGCA